MSSTPLDPAREMIVSDALRMPRILVWPGLCTETLKLVSRGERPKHGPHCQDALRRDQGVIGRRVRRIGCLERLLSQVCMAITRAAPVGCEASRDGEEPGGRIRRLCLEHADERLLRHILRVVRTAEPAANGPDQPGIPRIEDSVYGSQNDNPRIGASRLCPVSCRIQQGRLAAEE